MGNNSVFHTPLRPYSVTLSSDLSVYRRIIKKDKNIESVAKVGPEPTSAFGHPSAGGELKNLKDKRLCSPPWRGTRSGGWVRRRQRKTFASNSIDKSIRKSPLPFEFPGCNWCNREDEIAVLRVADFGMHVYYNIHSLVGKHSNSGDGFPWTLPANKRSVYDYRKGAMPRSDDLMERSIIMPIPSIMTKRDIADTICGIRWAAIEVF